MFYLYFFGINISAGAVMVTGASLFAIIYRDTISPSLAGLSISYALSVTQTLNWFVRVTAEVESKIVAVERLREFSVLPTEPIKSFDQAPTVAPNWPSQVCYCSIFNCPHVFLEVT